MIPRMVQTSGARAGGGEAGRVLGPVFPADGGYGEVCGSAVIALSDVIYQGNDIAALDVVDGPAAPRGQHDVT
jgi:hypothetical protein